MTNTAVVEVRCEGDSETYAVDVPDDFDFPDELTAEDLHVQDLPEFEDLTEVDGIGSARVADLQANFESVHELKHNIDSAELPQHVEDKLAEFLGGE